MERIYTSIAPPNSILITKICGVISIILQRRIPTASVGKIRIRSKTSAFNVQNVQLAHVNAIRLSLCITDS
jgi:hypothetical protein